MLRGSNEEARRRVERVAGVGVQSGRTGMQRRAVEKLCADDSSAALRGALLTEIEGWPWWEREAERELQHDCTPQTVARR